MSRKGFAAVKQLAQRPPDRLGGQAPHPDPFDHAAPDALARWRDAYLRWGRDTLGFAIYLFYRPGARMG